MADAPHDGTKIIIERQNRTRPIKYPIAAARWNGSSWHIQCSGSYARDDDLLGWWPHQDGWR